MNKIIASSGIVLVLIAGFLFLTVFSGGSVGGLVITGTSSTANFAAFLFVILFLPIGAALAFFGLAYRTPILAAGTQVVYRGSGGAGKAALALAVIAIIIGAGAFVYAFQSNQSSQISGLSSQLTTLSKSLNSSAAVNTAPGKIAYRVDWSNTDPTGQDRFNPETIVVTQGDIVQILFEHNDTDAHTFTMFNTTTPYGFQINDTAAGMRSFLTNQNYAGNCQNGTYAQDHSNLNGPGISFKYCVSGASLLQAGNGTNQAGIFKVAANPNPASPFTPGNNSGNPSVVLLPINNVVYINAFNASAPLAEVYGMGAFQATTPGVFEYFCDYHVSNGMFGYLVVLPNAYCNSNAQACGISNSTSTS